MTNIEKENEISRRELIERSMADIADFEGVEKDE